LKSATIGTILALSLQKPEGSRAKASEGEAVVGYCEPLVTPDLGSSGFPDLLGVAESEAQRVNNMASIDPILKIHPQLKMPVGAV